MQNLHDDNYMDDLSRQAADDYQPDQDLHSWESLRPRLEAALPQKKERKRRFLIIFLLFLLIGGGVVFSTVWNKSADKKVAEKPAVSTNTSAANQTKTAAPATNNAIPATEQKTSSPQTSIPNTTAKVDEPAATVQSNKTVTAPTNTITNKSSSTVINKPINTTVRNNRNNTSTNKKNNNDVVKSDVNDVDKPIAEKYGVLVPEKNIETKNPDPIVNNPTPEKTTAEKTPTDKPVEQTPQPSPTEKATVKNDKTKQSTPLKNRWEFGLVYAPDVSTVKFTHTQKPGTNVGLTVAYNLSKRFAIQAGALYTTKNYKSYGKDYHPPKGYWTDYVNLETVTADCNMWDIPVNLRYNLAPRKKSNLFASAGLSSYLMKKENYDYFYYYNGNPVNRQRSYYTDNKHWFAVLNLSVGYERQLSKNISVQAEPFFKQPLKGVGFGNVKLNTTGIYFSVKYKPLTAAGKPVKALR